MFKSHGIFYIKKLHAQISVFTKIIYIWKILLLFILTLRLRTVKNLCPNLQIPQNVLF